MRDLAGAFTVWLLAFMLVGTTPVGTNDAAHRDQLLHLVLAHVHTLDGQVMVDAAAPNGPGVRLGAGSGADAAAAAALQPDSSLVGSCLAAERPGRARPDWTSGSAA